MCEKKYDTSTIWFGKPTGTPFSALEQEYLQWLRDNSNYEPALEAVNAELERRAAGGAVGDPTKRPAQCAACVALERRVDALEVKVGINDDIPF